MERQWRPGVYVRYVDDIGRLREMKEAIRRQLWDLRLDLNAGKSPHLPGRGRSHVSRAGGSFPIVSGWCAPMSSASCRRMRGMQSRYARGGMIWKEAEQRIRAWLAHAAHGGTWKDCASICSKEFSLYGSDGVRSELRGGSWNNHSTNLRAANRNRNQPGNRNDNIGFRCVRDVERKARRLSRRGSRSGHGRFGRATLLPDRAPDAGGKGRGVKHQRDPRPCGSASEARPGLVEVSFRKILPAPPEKEKKGKGIKETTSRTQRNPKLSYLSPGWLLKRNAARRSEGIVVPQEPPRTTRRSPFVGPVQDSHVEIGDSSVYRTDPQPTPTHFQPGRKLPPASTLGGTDPQGSRRAQWTTLPVDSPMRVWRFIAPRRTYGIPLPAPGTFPLRLGWQPSARPFTISRGVNPTRAHHGPVGMPSLFFPIPRVPPTCWKPSLSTKAAILLHGYWIAPDPDRRPNILHALATHRHQLRRRFARLSPCGTRPPRF